MVEVGLVDLVRLAHPVLGRPTVTPPGPPPCGRVDTPARPLDRHVVAHRQVTFDAYNLVGPVRTFSPSGDLPETPLHGVAVRMPQVDVVRLAPRGPPYETRVTRPPLAAVVDVVGTALDSLILVSP